MKIDVGNDRWAFEPPPTRTLDCDAPVVACAFPRDGTSAAFALGDGHVRIVPTDLTVAIPREPAEPLHGGVALSLAADPFGDGYVSGGDDGRILRIDSLGQASELASWPGKWIDTLASHPKTGSAAIVGRMVMLLSREGAPRELGPHQSTVSDIDFSPDGARLAAAHYGGVTVWNLRDAAAPPRRFSWKGSHVRVRWSPDNKFVATATQENDIHVWRLAQATDMRMQGYPTKVKSLAWSADARWLLTGSQPCFTAWPFAGKGPEGKPPLQFGDQGAGLMTVVAAHPKAEFVAGGFDSGELQVGDLKLRRAMVIKLADRSPITALAWSPDGWRLAAGSEAGAAFVIDLRRS